MPSHLLNNSRISTKCHDVLQDDCSSLGPSFYYRLVGESSLAICLKDSGNIKSRCVFIMCVTYRLPPTLSDSSGTIQSVMIRESLCYLAKTLDIVFWPNAVLSFVINTLASVQRLFNAYDIISVPQDRDGAAVLSHDDTPDVEERPLCRIGGRCSSHCFCAGKCLVGRFSLHRTCFLWSHKISFLKSAGRDMWTLYAQTL